MQTMRTMMRAAALLIPLAACQTTATGATEVCSVWRSISWSSKDTAETVDGVKGNNARRMAWCIQNRFRLR